MEPTDDGYQLKTNTGIFNAKLSARDKQQFQVDGSPSDELIWTARNHDNVTWKKATVNVHIQPFQILFSFFILRSGGFHLYSANSKHDSSFFYFYFCPEKYI